MKAVGDAAASLAASLMEWGKQEEWAGTTRVVLVEAAELATQLFVLRVNMDRPLAQDPRLLSSVIEGGELVLTMGLSPSVVWRETFGTWASGHPRVIFQTVLSNPDRVGETITINYWDRENDRCSSRNVWPADDTAVGEFTATARTVHWGAPAFRFVVHGIDQAGREDALNAVFNVTSALGLHPRTARIDESEGSVTTGAFGELTPDRRRNLPHLLREMLKSDGIEVTFEPG